MIATIRSEFRKLFTIRSTYIISILSLLPIGLFSFWLEGYKGVTGSAASTLAPTALQEVASNGSGLAVLFSAIIAILFMAHEYRYNTIMYTLTANAHRTRVLFAKVITIVIFCVLYGFMAFAAAIGLYLAGLSLRDASLPPQEFDVLVQLAKTAFYYTGYALIGLLIASITRGVVMAVAAILVFPTVLEPLLGLLLKDNAKYLPFTSIDSAIGASMSPSTLSSDKAIMVTCVYLAIGLLVTWVLFVKRDAN